MARYRSGRQEGILSFEAEVDVIGAKPGESGGIILKALLSEDLKAKARSNKRDTHVNKIRP